MNLTVWLLVAAVLVNGLLVGASLDQTIKQLPARRRIGDCGELESGMDKWHGGRRTSRRKPDVVTDTY